MSSARTSRKTKSARRREKIPPFTQAMIKFIDPFDHPNTYRLYDAGMDKCLKLNIDFDAQRVEFQWENQRTTTTVAGVRE